MNKSELSAACRARRDAIFAEMKSSGKNFTVDRLERRLVEEVQPAVLGQFEAKGWYFASAELMHYQADKMVWLSVCKPSSCHPTPVQIPPC